MLVVLVLAWWWTVGVSAERAVGGGGRGGRAPNILVLLADDLGIGDLGCYGNDTINTPHIDRLASEGVRLTHHLAAATLCTPSRAALLTARYPARYGMVEDEKEQWPVLAFTTSGPGLPQDEVTIAEVLQAANYTTAIVGKWHLGMNCSFLGRHCPGPLNHGFQSFYGMPVGLFQSFKTSGPFWTFPLEEDRFQGLAVAWVVVVCSLLLGHHRRTLGATSVLLLLFLTHFVMFLAWFSFAHLYPKERSPWLASYSCSLLIRDGRVAERPLELDGLSQRLVEESRRFIAAHARDDQPFFLLHAFGHVHTPMFSAKHRKGRSRHGRYGDNVEELDEGVGAIMETLSDLGLDNNTIVYFASDHGAHLEAVEPGTMERIGGHNGRYKGGKGQGETEGGVRVGGIYRWAGRLPAGVTVDMPTSLMDLMPTVLSLAGLHPLPQLLPHAAHKEMDGVDISPLLIQDEKEGKVKKQMEKRIFLHHCGQSVHAIRLHTGEHVYKLYLYKTRWHSGSTQCGWGASKFCSCFDDVHDLTHEPHLYDLTHDPYEDLPPISPQTEEYQVVTKELLGYLEGWRARVQYPPSLLSMTDNFVWRFWLQPY